SLFPPPPHTLTVYNVVKPVPFEDSVHENLGPCNQSVSADWLPGPQVLHVGRPLEAPPCIYLPLLSQAFLDVPFFLAWTPVPFFVFCFFFLLPWALVSSTPRTKALVQ
ncbi:unnamed protein product, partial [Discosporangium mesarthrocarpum]